MSGSEAGEVDPGDRVPPSAMAEPPHPRYRSAAASIWSADPTVDRADHRRKRAGLLAWHLVVVLATIPWLGNDPDWLLVGVWLLAGAGLAVASFTAALDRWVTRFGPAVFIAMVLWLVLLTGGHTSAYGVLYIPVVGIMAVVRETRAFVVTLLLALGVWLLPEVLGAPLDALAVDGLIAFVVAATLFIVHRAAADFRDANRLYVSVLEHHAGPTYLISPDAVMVWANEPAQHILGLPLERIAGVPWPQLVAEGEVERLMPQFLAALDGVPQEITFETDAPGGKYRLRGTIFPIRRGGRVTSLMGITQDVTELHTAAFGAQALRRTLDLLAFPVAIFDADTSETLYANRTAWRLTGTGEEAGTDLGWSDLHPDLQIDRPAPGNARTVNILRQTDGTAAELDVTIQCVEGTRTILVMTGADATERARREHTLRQLAAAESDAAERLRHLDRMKNAFLTAVSHELRTPVTVILGGAKTLQRMRGRADAESRDHLEDALARQAEQLSTLLSDLLDLDRLTRGPTRTSASSFDVVELVRQQMEALPGSGTTTIEAPSQLEVFADQVEIERIVANLLDNAAKYAPGAPVTVRVAPRDDGGFRLEVADEGPGIPAEDRKQVFEPFYRADLDHPQPGTGIGLALVAEFAAIHGGRAWAEPVTDTGTRIVVEIPERRTSPGDATPAGASQLDDEG